MNVVVLGAYFSCSQPASQPLRAASPVASVYLVPTPTFSFYLKLAPRPGVRGVCGGGNSIEEAPCPPRCSVAACHFCVGTCVGCVE